MKKKQHWAVPLIDVMDRIPLDLNLAMLEGVESFVQPTRVVYGA